VQHALRVDDRMLVAALNLLRSEALAGTRRVDAALSLLIPFGARSSIAESGQQAAYYRAAGAVLAHARSDLCELMFGRFLAISELQQSRAGTHEIRQFDGVRETVRAGGGNKRTESSIVVADTLAASFNFAHNPNLLAQELLRAIDALDCSPETRVISRARDAVAPATPAHSYSLLLGEQRGRQFFLTCKIPDDAAKAMALAGVLRIGDAARWSVFGKRSETKPRCGPQRLLRNTPGRFSPPRRCRHFWPRRDVSREQVFPF
jgi:hypothetical protein